MSARAETAAVVALLRAGRQPWSTYADLIEVSGDARAVLEDEIGLLAGEQLEQATAELARWREQEIQALSVLDPGYPQNLRAVHDRPALIFVSGELRDADVRSVAVIGSRRPSAEGVRRARAVADELVQKGFTVISGLAAGIDAAAHRTAFEAGGRTLAVVGTGLRMSYPAQNATLQRQIAQEGAVVSRFWPEDPPSRKSFPLRNAVMSGMALATVIIEASPASGTRTQARSALAHGRPVLLSDALLDQEWARQLAERPGVHVVGSAGEVTQLVERISSPDMLVA